MYVFVWRYICSVSLSSRWDSCDVGFLFCHKSILCFNLFRCYSSHLSVHSMCSSRLLPHSECITPTNIQPLSNGTPVRPDTLHWFSSVPAVLFTFPPLLICWGEETCCWSSPQLFKCFCGQEIKETHTSLSDDECWAVKQSAHVSILIIVRLIHHWGVSSWWGRFRLLNENHVDWITLTETAKKSIKTKLNTLFKIEQATFSLNHKYVETCFCAQCFVRFEILGNSAL